MTFEQYIKTLDIDANLSMSVFGLEDLRTTWDAAFTRGYDEGWDDCEKHENEVWRKGHVLVPVEPTAAMCAAFWAEYEKEDWFITRAYKAMIQAAQEKTDGLD